MCFENKRWSYKVLNCVQNDKLVFFVFDAIHLHTTVYTGCTHFIFKIINEHASKYEAAHGEDGRTLKSIYQSIK